MRMPKVPNSVAELITSLVNTATLASKSDCRRMQYWQPIRPKNLIHINTLPGERIL